MWVQSLGQEDPLEEDMATHSSVLAWRISWTQFINPPLLLLLSHVSSCPTLCDSMDCSPPGSSVRGIL